VFSPLNTDPSMKESVATTLRLAHGFNIRLYERLGLRRDDGVTIAAQSSHSVGSPMSQRECAGFNWPPLSIPAAEPVSISPEAVSRAVAFEQFHATLPNSEFSGTVQSDAPSLWSLVVVVGQPASCVSVLSELRIFPPVLPWQSPATGVGHPVQSFSDMRCADAASWKYNRPAGVALFFQVSLYKVEPAVLDSRINLFAKNRVRSALADEIEERRPEVSGIVEPFAFTGNAEGLTWAASGPHGSVIRPPCAPESVGPDSDSREEVALGVTSKIRWVNIGNAPLVHVSGGDMSCLDKLP